MPQKFDHQPLDPTARLHDTTWGVLSPIVQAAPGNTPEGLPDALQTTLEEVGNTSSNTIRAHRSHMALATWDIMTAHARGQAVTADMQQAARMALGTCIAEQRAIISTNSENQAANKRSLAANVILALLLRNPDMYALVGNPAIPPIDSDPVKPLYAHTQGLTIPILSHLRDSKNARPRRDTHINISCGRILMPVIRSSSATHVDRYIQMLVKETMQPLDGEEATHLSQLGYQVKRMVSGFVRTRLEQQEATTPGAPA